MTGQNDGPKHNKDYQRGIFAAIQNGRHDYVMKLIDSHPQVLNQRDAVGAAPVHAAFLYGRDEIGKAMVERHPKCSRMVYTGQRFKGETILHLAIARRDADLSCWLLEKCPQLINFEATGTFFDPGGDAYFGGYPILFAVSTNQPVILDKILETHTPDNMEELKNSIFLVDRFKNTALHMAVLHDLPEMYDFALSIAEFTDQEWECPFTRWLNSDRLSALGLAAALGRVTMFQHILATQVKLAWTYGPIIAKMIPLTGLEQPHLKWKGCELVAARQEVLALQCICGSKYDRLTNCLKMENSRVSEEVQQARLKLIEVPEIRQLLDTKWESFGKPYFWRMISIRVAIQISWMVTVLMPHHWRLDMKHLTEHYVENGLIIVLELFVLFFCVRRLWWELFGLFLQRANRLSRRCGAAAVEATFGVLFSAFFIMSLVLRISKQEAEEVFAALTGLVGWSYMLFFLLGFRQTGPYVLMILEIVKGDMQRFIKVFSVIFLAYATSLYVVCDWQQNPGWYQFFIQMKQLFLLTTGANFPFEEYMGTNWLSPILILSFIIMVIILLLNLLIAQMNSTYSAIDENSENAWYVEKANIMAAFEGLLTVHQMQENRMHYAVAKYYRGQDTSSDLSIELYLQVTVVEKDWNQELEGAPISDSPRGAPTENMSSSFNKSMTLENMVSYRCGLRGKKKSFRKVSAPYDAYGACATPRHLSAVRRNFVEPVPLTSTTSPLSDNSNTIFSAPSTVYSPDPSPPSSPLLGDPQSTMEATDLQDDDPSTTSKLLRSLKSQNSSEPLDLQVPTLQAPSDPSRTTRVFSDERPSSDTQSVASSIRSASTGFIRVGSRYYSSSNQLIQKETKGN